MPRMRQRRGRAAGRTKRGPSLPGRERRRVERYVARRLRREERSVHPCVDEARRRRDSLDGEDGLALVVDAQKRCAGVVDRPEPFFGVAACQFRQVARRLDQDLPLLDDDEARRGRRPEHGHLLSILAQVRHSVDGRWQRSAPVLVRAQFLAKRCGEEPARAFGEESHVRFTVRAVGLYHFFSHHFDVPRNLAPLRHRERCEPGD
mmetsp:Transcript_27591/g.92682  ORF Transcript_27591/g.92682 Transcript_27591/m.92682 type:complete len:205 (-) Transcript_27591:418-1032(-)